MRIARYATIEELDRAGGREAFLDFFAREAQANFFQSAEFMEFIRPVDGFRPVLFLAVDTQGAVAGSLLGVFQRDGGGVKAWMSRRLIVNGGPLGDVAAASSLIEAMLKDAQGNAIYVEFRNCFDTSHQRAAFESLGFTFRPHLNFLLPLEGEEAALKKLSGNRRRQIRSSLAAGATYGEATSVEEVEGLYTLLHSLYRDKVGKPLPSLQLFKRLHDSPDGRIFVVRFAGKVIGGSAGPVHQGRTSYQWYVCGDNSMDGVHASVLATWAQIEHAARAGYRLFDFMGAGKPGQGYGVYEFKARFGGTEVCFGRYDKVLAPALYRLGVFGLNAQRRVINLIPGAR